jgi:hypothetical protein
MTEAEQKAHAIKMKRQVVASDSILKDFNWQLNMPLDSSSVKRTSNAVLDHSAPREVSVLQRDVRAPLFDLTFECMTDDQAREAADQDPNQ